jgi:hypothetical protein
MGADALAELMAEGQALEIDDLLARSQRVIEAG